MSPVRERSRYFQRGLISQEHGVAQSLGLPKIPAKLTLAFLLRLRPVARLQRDRSSQAFRISQSLNAPAIVFYRVSFDFFVAGFG
jgi:hypothetical protein